MELFIAVMVSFLMGVASSLIAFRFYMIRKFPMLKEMEDGFMDTDAEAQEFLELGNELMQEAEQMKKDHDGDNQNE